MLKFMKIWKNQKGLALDEAVLAVGMVASLGVFVAINVPWNSFFSASAQILGDLERVEMANSEFHSRHRVWPHQTTNGDWKRNVSVLVSTRAMRYPYNTMTSFKNLLPDFNTDKQQAQVQHAFGSGGSILQRPISFKGDEYIEIILENVPVIDARELDVAVDGAYDPDNGRVYLVFDRDDAEIANVHYRANSI